MAKMILVIDDQPCVRKLLSDELLEEGYQVEGTGSIENALKRLNTARPDLIVLDLYLDEGDGFSAFQAIKAQFPTLPVIIFTAYDSYRDDARLSGADGYVIKSLNLGKLKKKIAENLHSSTLPAMCRASADHPSCVAV